MTKSTITPGEIEFIDRLESDPGFRDQIISGEISLLIGIIRKLQAQQAAVPDMIEALKRIERLPAHCSGNEAERSAELDALARCSDIAIAAL